MDRPLSLGRSGTTPLISQPWVYPVWDSLGFLDLGDYFLPHFREVFNYYLFKYFLMVFLFEEAVPGPSVFPSGEPGVSGDFWGSQEGCQGVFLLCPWITFDVVQMVCLTLSQSP